MKTAALQRWILCEKHFSMETLSSIFFITTVWIYKSEWIQRVSSAVIKSEHGTVCSLLNLHNSFNILIGKKGKDGIKSWLQKGLTFLTVVKKGFFLKDSSRMSEKSQSPFSSHFQWVYICVKKQTKKPTDLEVICCSKYSVWERWFVDLVTSFPANWALTTVLCKRLLLSSQEERWCPYYSVPNDANKFVLFLVL